MKYLAYRPEIDGLRALAVVSVILYHAGVPGLEGGYLGVDVFFVISGYLITSVILGDLQSKKFSIARFYERRARRILPALIAVVLATIPLAILTMTPNQFDDFAQSLLATTLFVSNHYFWHQTGYFAPEVADMPLLHTWSLAVEEQFYLVFPVCMVLLWRLRRERLGLALWVTALGSFALCLLAARFAPTANFYLAPTRVWELLAGALVALRLKDRAPRPNATLAWLGLAAILSAMFVFDESVRHPSFFTLWPVAGTAAVLLWGHRRTGCARVLSARPFVSIGLISYSAYLWHQPLFAFARIQTLEPPPLFVMLGLAGLSLGLAGLSWRYIEQPFRRGAAPTSKVLRASGLALATLAGVAVFLPQGANVAARYVFEEAPDYHWDNRALRAETWAPLRVRTSDPRYRVLKNPSDQALWFRESLPGKIVIVGNSHSKDLYNILSHSHTVREAFELARYGAQLSDVGADFFGSANVKASGVVLFATEYRAADLQALPDLIEATKALGKTPVIALSAPAFPGSVDRTLADDMILPALRHRADWAHLPKDIAGAHWKALRPEIRATNAALRRIAARTGALVLDRVALACDRVAARCPAVSATLEKYYFDGTHPTLAGAKVLGEAVDHAGWADALTCAGRPHASTCAVAALDRRPR